MTQEANRVSVKGVVKAEAIRSFGGPDERVLAALTHPFGEKPLDECSPTEVGTGVALGVNAARREVGGTARAQFSADAARRFLDGVLDQHTLGAGDATSKGRLASFREHAHEALTSRLGHESERSAAD